MTDADALIPYLAGWLAGTLWSEGRKTMRIVDLQPDSTTGFVVTFASGTRLRVTVAVAEQAPAPPRAESPGGWADDGR